MGVLCVKTVPSQHHAHCLYRLKPSYHWPCHYNCHPLFASQCTEANIQGEDGPDGLDVCTFLTGFTSVCAQVSLSSGNLLIIGGCTSAIIGLSWAGIQAPWNSAKTLAPIIVGLFTLVAAVVYEAKVPKEPTVSSTLPQSADRLTTSRFHLTFSRIEQLFSGKRSKISQSGPISDPLFLTATSQRLFNASF